MLRQEIELYQESLRPQKVWLDGSQILLVLLLVLLPLIGWYAWGEYIYRKQLAEQTRLNTEFNRLTESIADLAAKQPSGPDPALELGVRRLENEIRHLMALQRVVLPVTAGEQPASLLRGLARQKPNGLWLDHIFLSGAGRDLVLQGKLYSATLLPGYIERLAREPVFSGQEFHTVQIGQTESDDSNAATQQAMAFRLVSGCAGGVCSQASAQSQGAQP